jgi:putative ABC transport system substrate-binding protein
MDRRAFLGTLGLLAVPRPVESLAAEKVWRLGVLSGAFPDRDECLDALKQGLKELGYVEGQTHTLEPRWTEGRNEPFTRFAIDLVRTKVDLIVAQTIEAVTAAKVATSTIPIVMASSSYPVEMGLVVSRGLAATSRAWPTSLLT